MYDKTLKTKTISQFCFTQTGAPGCSSGAGWTELRFGRGFPAAAAGHLYHAVHIQEATGYFIFLDVIIHILRFLLF